MAQLHPLRIAVAGAGAIGQAHIAAIGAQADCRLSAIVDPAPAARELAQRAGVPLWRDLGELIAHDRPDAVVLATPNRLHAPQAAQCMHARLPILLEKPVTATVIVLDVMWIWNDFLLPLLMVNGSPATRTLVLAAYNFVGQLNTKWHYALAAMVLALLPSVVFFILLQKYIVEGVVAGSIKG